MNTWTLNCHLSLTLSMAVMKLVLSRGEPHRVGSDKLPSGPEVFEAVPLLQFIVHFID